jgi:hypothetical protein
MTGITKCYIVLLIMCLVAFAEFVPATENDSAIPGVEMIIWERQDWEPNGGYERLTLWASGHSEVEVVPRARIPSGPTDLVPKEGWTSVRQEHQIRFLRKDIYSPEVSRAKLRQAVQAGVLDLKTFRAGYLDGGGTRVVVQINGTQTETVIPMFVDDDKESVNHHRFIAVSKILDGFDTDAFEMITR